MVSGPVAQTTSKRKLTAAIGIYCGKTYWAIEMVTREWENGRRLNSLFRIARPELHPDMDVQYGGRVRRESATPDLAELRLIRDGDRSCGI